MLRSTQQICSVGTCPHGCTNETGCCGAEYRERYAERDIEAAARQLVDYADRHGLVITIEQAPLQPLAMGHHRSVVSVRRKRHG